MFLVNCMVTHFQAELHLAWISTRQGFNDDARQVSKVGIAMQHSGRRAPCIDMDLKTGNIAFNVGEILKSCASVYSFYHI